MKYRQRTIVGCATTERNITSIEDEEEAMINSMITKANEDLDLQNNAPHESMQNLNTIHNIFVSSNTDYDPHGARDK